MSNSKDLKANLGFLKNLLATAFCACLFTIAFLSAGVSQTPGYSQEPDKWAPYASGRYFDHLQKIVSIYKLSGWQITYLHFEVSGLPIGPVDLFRISRGPECSGENDCYFVLFSSDMPDAPLITECQFKWGGYTHLFNPDGSNFWGFEFACKDTLLQLKVTPTHFFPISVRKTE